MRRQHYCLDFHLLLLAQPSRLVLADGFALHLDHVQVHSDTESTQLLEKEHCTPVLTLGREWVQQSTPPSPDE
jgi:hypothetical protein